MSRMIIYAIILPSLLVSFSATAGPDECRDATEQLHPAQEQVESDQSNVNDAAEAYASCVKDNSEPGGCDSEHDELEHAQDDLESAQSEKESALSNFNLECNR